MLSYPRSFIVVAALTLFSMGFPARGFAQDPKKPKPAAVSPEADSEDADDQTEQLQPTKEQVRFVREYVSAVNNKDLEAMLRLVPPKTLACYTDRTRPYLNDWLRKQFDDPIATPYEITVETREESDLPRTVLFTLPVVPSFQVNISTKLRGEDKTLGRPIAYEHGQWYEAAPCPTDEGMAQFLKREERERAKAEGINKLYSNLSDPLRSDLKSLISGGKTELACQKYSLAAHVTYQTGCAVVHMLAANMKNSK